MSERIMTLFGEEIVPEQLKAVGKSRAKKKPEEKKEEETKPDQQEIIPAAAIQQAPLPPIVEEVAPVTEQAEPKIEAVPEINTEVSPQETNEVIAETEPVVIAVPKKRAKKEEKSAEDNIILPEDWQGEKKYYSIGEVADLFKVKTSHIRFWTNEFKLKVRTTRKGDRLFTPEQIRELRTIHHLVKERGFTLAGAKAKLKEQNNMDIQTVDLKQSLLQLRNKLVTIKNQLT